MIGKSKSRLSFCPGLGVLLCISLVSMRFGFCFIYFEMIFFASNKIQRCLKFNLYLFFRSRGSSFRCPCTDKPHTTNNQQHHWFVLCTCSACVLSVWAAKGLWVILIFWICYCELSVCWCGSLLIALSNEFTCALCITLWLSNDDDRQIYFPFFALVYFHFVDVAGFHDDDYYCWL